LRIAFLTSEFVTENNFAGGLAQYMGRVTTGLVKRGHNVEVFVTSQTNNIFEYKGITVHRVTYQPWLPLKTVNFLLYLLRKKRLVESQLACCTALGLYKALQRRARKVEFDIVQAASWLATGFFAAKKPLVPLVVRVSSYEPLLAIERNCPLTFDKKLYSQIELSVMRHAQAVYSPSDFLAEQVFKKTGIKPKVIRPPFDESDYSDSPATTDKISDWPDYLLYFGKITRYKGAWLLADAVRTLLKMIPDLHLVIAGPFSKQDYAANKLLQLTKKHPDSVRYLGILDPVQLLSVMKKARVVVLPSLIDNLPNGCIEAMGMGKVVVGPNGISFDELITDGQSGILFKKGNVLSLREAIVRAWNLSEEKRETMSRSAKERIAQLSPDITLTVLEKFYEKVIQQNGRFRH